MTIPRVTFFDFLFNNGRGIKKDQVDWTVTDTTFDQIIAGLIGSVTGSGNTAFVRTTVPGPSEGENGDVALVRESATVLKGYGKTGGAWVEEWSFSGGGGIQQTHGNYIPTAQTANILPTGGFFWYIPDNAALDIVAYIRGADGNYTAAFNVDRRSASELQGLVALMWAQESAVSFDSGTGQLSITFPAAGGGASFVTGTAVPTSAEGEDGSHYLRQSTPPEIWTRAVDTWTRDFVFPIANKVMFGNPSSVSSNLEIRTETRFRPVAGDAVIFVMPSIPAGPPAGNLSLRSRYGESGSQQFDSALELRDIDGVVLQWDDVTGGRIYEAVRTGAAYRIIEPTDHQFQQLVGAMFSEQSEVTYDDSTRKLTIAFPTGGRTAEQFQDDVAAMFANVSQVTYNDDGPNAGTFTITFPSGDIGQTLQEVLDVSNLTPNGTLGQVQNNTFDVTDLKRGESVYVNVIVKVTTAGTGTGGTGPIDLALNDSGDFDDADGEVVGTQSGDVAGVQTVHEEVLELGPYIHLSDSTTTRRFRIHRDGNSGADTTARFGMEVHVWRATGTVQVPTAYTDADAVSALATALRPTSLWTYDSGADTLTLQVRYDGIAGAPIHVQPNFTDEAASAVNEDELLWNTTTRRLYRNVFQSGHGATMTDRDLTDVDLRTLTGHNVAHYAGNLPNFAALPSVGDASINDYYFLRNNSHWVWNNGTAWMTINSSSWQVHGAYQHRDDALGQLAVKVHSGSGVGQVVFYDPQGITAAESRPRYVTAYTAPTSDTRVYEDYLADVIDQIESANTRVATNATNISSLQSSVAFEQGEIDTAQTNITALQARQQVMIHTTQNSYDTAAADDDIIHMLAIT